MKLWHYTTKDRVDEIIESGEIRTSTENRTGSVNQQLYGYPAIRFGRTPQPN